MTAEPSKNRVQPASSSVPPPSLHPPAPAPRPLSIPPPVPESPAPTWTARVLPNVVAGAISGTLIISFGISLSALIFAGPEARHLSAGIGLLLFGTFVVAAVVALGSSYRPVIAAPQENTSVILALIAASIGRRLPAGDAALPTIVVALGVTSIATGALFLLLGSLRLGKIVRFIPYPVVGGFLAGTGFLLVQGSLSVMTDLPVGLRDLPALFAPAVLARWVPGFAFGAVVTAVLRRRDHPLLLPGLIAFGIAAFYLVVVASGLGVAGAMAGHHLLGPFDDAGRFPPFGLSALGRVEWSLVWQNAGNIAACTVLAAISVLLNATGLELATEQDLDLDRELRVTGLANVAVGLVGGVPGYLSLSESALNQKVGARSRAPGLIAAALALVTLFAGTQLLAHFPKPILGGMLCFLGFSFLLDNLHDAYYRLPRLEYAVVWGILFVVVIAGFLEGVGAGIVVSSFLFAVNYAGIDVVKHAISGDRLRSKAGRPPAHESTLQRAGGHVHVMQLQGYIFFGTAYQLLLRVKARLTTERPLAAYFVVLDFRHVSGLDSSAVVSFVRMRKLAEAHRAVLVLTGLRPAVRRQLVRSGCLAEDEPVDDAGAGAAWAIRTFSDLDHGLEWCENQLIASAGERRDDSETLTRELATVVRHGVLVRRLLGYLTRIEVEAGTGIYRKGEESQDLYLIESGELTAWIELEDGSETRLRTMGAGTVVGESGLYLGARRSASVRATQPSVLYRLSLTALDRMTREAPELAAAFHQFIARQLADRMVNTTSPAQMLFY